MKEGTIVLGSNLEFNPIYDEIEWEIVVFLKYDENLEGEEKYICLTQSHDGIFVECFKTIKPLKDKSDVYFELNDDECEIKQGTLILGRFEDDTKWFEGEFLRYEKNMCDNYGKYICLVSYEGKKEVCCFEEINII